MGSFRTTVLLVIAACVGYVSTEHCYPGMSCWPQYQDFINLFQSLDGNAHFATDPEYQKEVLMYNTRVTRMPYLIVLAETVDDVVKCVNFGTRFKIRITVRSSGHDYIGRSTADGSLQINLRLMKGLKFNMNSKRNPAGEVTAESGNTWIRVYNESNKLGRSIVGGSAKTVSMGGYTLGGGHSPIGRKFGMAVDNLLDIEMVSANGSLVYANSTTTTLIDPATGAQRILNNGDLFWAIRGGGGSTYGIVTKFTFKLHYDSKMVSMGCRVPYVNEFQLKVGEDFLKPLNNLLSTTLAPEWGGYELIEGKFNTETWTKGSVSLYLNHYGEWGSPSFNTIKPFLSKYHDYCQLVNRSSFLDYEVTTYDPIYYRSYIMNILMQPDSFTDDFYNYMFNLTTADLGVDGSAGCTGAFIGGNMQKLKGDDTAVNPSFRTGVLSLTCGIGWNSEEEASHVAAAEKLTAGLLKFGKGTYFNEPSAYLPNWKVAYWGGHYDRLLEIKKMWDPSNVFSCYHCVGSELADGLTANPSTYVG